MCPALLSTWEIAESNGQLESVQPSFAFGESGFVGVGATIYFPQ
jgi:hypothetical protein